jgi:hypothetical protein
LLLPSPKTTSLLLLLFCLSWPLLLIRSRNLIGGDVDATDAIPPVEGVAKWCPSPPPLLLSSSHLQLFSSSLEDSLLACLNWSQQDQGTAMREKVSI